MTKSNILIHTMIALVGFVVLTFGAPTSWAQTGVDNPAVFELDGNTQDSTPLPAGLDWESTFPPGVPLTANPIQVWVVHQDRSTIHEIWNTGNISAPELL